MCISWFLLLSLGAFDKIKEAERDSKMAQDKVDATNLVIQQSEKIRDDTEMMLKNKWVTDDKLGIVLKGGIKASSNFTSQQIILSIYDFDWK